MRYSFRDSEPQHSVILRPVRRMGLTLVECLLAVLILSVAVLGMSYATTSGHEHLHHSDTRLRAIRVAEHLMEEIQSRPYDGSGGIRSEFCIDDFNGFAEDAGGLADFSNTPYDEEDQAFSRSATVVAANLVVPELENVIIPGKTVTVTVSSMAGSQWVISRFIPEPAAP